MKKEVTYGELTERPGLLAPETAHSAMMTRYDFTRQAVRGGSILEVACGTGIGLSYLAEEACEVVGMEIDYENVALAQTIHGSRFGLCQGDACTLPFPDERFDCVALLDAIYWLPDARQFIREARRVLRHRGRLVITTLNIQWIGWTKGWAAPKSTRYWTASELRAMLEREGFRVEIWVGFHDDGKGPKRWVVHQLRKFLFASPFAPKSLKGRERIKRLVYRSMRPFPDILRVNHAKIEPLTPLGEDTTLREYQMLYVLGKKT